MHANQIKPNLTINCILFVYAWKIYVNIKKEKKREKKILKMFATVSRTYEKNVRINEAKPLNKDNYL